MIEQLLEAPDQLGIRVDRCDCDNLECGCSMDRDSLRSGDVVRVAVFRKHGCGVCIPVNATVHWLFVPIKTTWVGESEATGVKTDCGFSQITVPVLCPGIRYRLVHTITIDDPERDDFGETYSVFWPNVLAT